MLNGDISNRSSESIAVMCMDNLIFMKKIGILERISTSIMGRFFTAKFDSPNGYALLDKSWIYRTKAEAETALPAVAAEMEVQYEL